MPAVQFAEFGLALGARRQGRLDVAEAHARRVLAANQARLPRGGMTLQMYGERGVASRGRSRLALGERACAAAFERGARRRPDVLPEAATRPV
jgi:hypothetical protein